MAEKHILLTVICLFYLGLSVSACGSKGISQGNKWVKNQRQSSYQKTNQLNQHAMTGSNIYYPKQYSQVPYKNQLNQHDMAGSNIYYPKQYYQVPYKNQLNQHNMAGSNIYYPKQYSQIPSTMYNPASNIFIPPKAQYNDPNFKDRYMNTQQNSYGCFRGVRSMPINQGETSVGNKDATQSLSHDINLRNDLIKKRVRRNIDETTAATDSTRTQSWADFINSLITEMNLNEDKKLSDRRQVTENLKDSADDADDISTSDTSSETSVEFFDRVRQQIPYFFQRLKSIRTLVKNNPTSYEDDADVDSLDNYDEKLDTNNYAETIMNGQLEKTNDDVTSVEELTSDVMTTEKLLKELKIQDSVKMIDTTEDSNISIKRHENTTPKL